MLTNLQGIFFSFNLEQFVRISHIKVSKLRRNKQSPNLQPYHNEIFHVHKKILPAKVQLEFLMAKFILNKTSPACCAFFTEELERTIQILHLLSYTENLQETKCASACD
jgi:hypothetical protein